MKKILIIGSGGREHAIAWKLSQSKHIEHIYVIPGNDGMISKKISITNIDTLDFKSLIKFVKEENIYLTIVGPEIELSLGIVDEFEKENLNIFGPDKYNSQLESSKIFCKNKMKEFDIPSARFKKFKDYEKAIKYISNLSYPIVIKANGLAAGKGVSIPFNYDDAKNIIREHLIEKKFNQSSLEIIIEEYLEGIEFSQLAFVNGDKISYMQIVRDYKRVFDDDLGDNTGGMGAFTPVHTTKKIMNETREIIKKMILGMKNIGKPYKGILYAGLISTKEGVKVIEFNVRFGDPETELILSAMESDLFLIIDNIMNNKVIDIHWSKESYVGVVLASKGYPKKYLKNIPLPLFKNNNRRIFYMGVKEKDNKLISNGGRVLISVGNANNIKLAKINAYADFNLIDTDHFIYRKDIAS